MRQDEMARPLMRAAEVEEIRERIALAKRFLREDNRDEAALAQARALLEDLERAKSLEDEWNSAVGAGPCMRIAPWKGNGHDGD